MARARRIDVPSWPTRALMDALLVLAVMVFLRMLVAFFATVAASAAGSWYLSATRSLVPPIAGAWSIRSPYGGAFSVDAGIVIVVLLFAEWLLAAASSRAAEKGTGDE